jgi:Fur family peroxide stress response transcriptional regulator
MQVDDILKILRDNSLKITPQRMAVLQAIHELSNHPTAENIIGYIKQTNPNIATGTVYKILDTFVQKGIITRVKTDRDIMHYDSITENHHHLYCHESDRIEDYFDQELNSILEEYFKQKSIPNFNIEDIKLQIIGKFNKLSNN